MEENILEQPVSGLSIQITYGYGCGGSGFNPDEAIYGEEVVLAAIQAQLPNATTPTTPAPV